MRGQTRDSVPRGVSCKESLAGKNIPTATAPPQRHATSAASPTGRHRSPVLSGKEVVEKCFCLHVWISPWCKLVTSIATMNDKQQRSFEALQHQLCSEHH